MNVHSLRVLNLVPSFHTLRQAQEQVQRALDAQAADLALKAKAQKAAEAQAQEDAAAASALSTAQRAVRAQTKAEVSNARWDYESRRNLRFNFSKLSSTMLTQVKSQSLLTC